MTQLLANLPKFSSGQVPVAIETTLRVFLVAHKVTLYIIVLVWQITDHDVSMREDQAVDLVQNLQWKS